MLAPLIVDLLMGKLLLLLVGWTTDASRASMYDRPGDANPEAPGGWNRMSRPGRPSAAQHPDAKGTARAVWWHRLSGRPRTSHRIDPEPAGTCTHSGLRPVWTGDEADHRTASPWS
jgi:hypothetical protein